MNKRAFGLPADFPQLLKEIKDRIQQAQTRAILAANAELVRMYWYIGRIIEQRQQQKGWGAAVIPRLSRELRNELPDMKGFSERNIKSMLAFYRAYPDPIAFVQQPAAQLSAKRILRLAAKSAAAKKVQQPVAQLPDSLLWAVPWGHHLLLMLKFKHVPTRLCLATAGRAAG